jgi:hypothetical protein
MPGDPPFGRPLRQHVIHADNIRSDKASYLQPLSEAL